MGATDPLRLDVRRTADRVVISLEGELDLASTPLLQSAIDSAELGDSQMLVLDLDRLDFLDSTGLRTILAAREDCRERGRQFAVTPGSQQVQRLLTVTRANEHLPTVASADEPRA